MLFIFSGGDEGAVREEMGRFLEKTGGGVAPIVFEEGKAEEFMATALGKTLFGESLNILAEDGVLKNEEIEEKALSLIGSDHNIFLRIFKSLPVAISKKIEKEGAKIFSFTSKERRPAFNSFSVADAFASADKKTLWVQYQKALRFGVPAEEISGIIFWQIKTLLLVEAGNLEGVSPYASSKARSALRKHDKVSLLKSAEDLTHIYHRSHAGEMDFEYGLERFILDRYFLSK